MFFEVIPTDVYREDGGALTYHFEQQLTPGQIVLIPLGRKTVTGVVLRRISAVNFPTKAILRVIHPTPIPTHLLKAISWLSEYYLSPLPACAAMMLPAGLVSKRVLSKKPPTDSTEPLLAPSAPREAPKTTGSPFSATIPLNSAQRNALQALQQAPGPTRLLRGVTGSGKTNIYLKMAANALKTQKSTILLVPEIALTSQLVKIFTSTFGERVVLIHSNQTLVERRRTWLALLESPQPQIIIGPRSALLAPLHNLGLIIIDEAHESTYYQENSPRYSALRLASFIAHTLEIPCLQGTATPNIVDFHLAKTHHSLVELSKKAKSSAITPEITVVDAKDRANFQQNRYFSDPLLTKIQQSLLSHHQSLIFHNRRGSAPLTLCEKCGWQALCPNCYLPLTLHADGFLLTCHICGHETKVPSSCPSCQHPDVIHKGFGTKLLESELKRLFPSAKIARFDGDNTKTDNLTSLYQAVKDGQIDILIGTQTLARGLDLPLLATVGVVQADSGLSLPDFAAEERTFELLNQVIGRVGRGHLDEADVVIQTYQPEHPAIQAAITSNFSAFADYLLRRRRAQKLPPFAYLAKLSITYKTEATTLKKITAAWQTLSQNPKLQVSPPMPAFHERTNRGYTWQIVIKSSSRQTLRQALLPFRSFHLEFDPPSML